MLQALACGAGKGLMRTVLPTRLSGACCSPCAHCSLVGGGRKEVGGGGRMRREVTPKTQCVSEQGRSDDGSSCITTRPLP